MRLRRVFEHDSAEHMTNERNVDLSNDLDSSDQFVGTHFIVLVVLELCVYVCAFNRNVNSSKLG